MRSGQSALHHFSLTAEEASEEGMVCGGTMDIFIDVWDVHALPALAQSES
jgi:xanthine/CO dehydrogenase XdhC/CoxF family maturation factor